MDYETTSKSFDGVEATMEYDAARGRLALCVNAEVFPAVTGAIIDNKDGTTRHEYIVVFQGTGTHQGVPCPMPHTVGIAITKPQLEYLVDTLISVVDRLDAIEAKRDAGEVGP